MATPKTQVYSYSRLSTYSKCPRNYKLKYVDRIREAFDSVEAHLGRAVHAALAWLYGTRESLASPDRSGLLDKFDALWGDGLGPRIRIIRRDDSLEARKRDGRAMLTAHHEGPYRRDRLATIATEQDLRTKLDGAYPYMGIVDRLAKDAEGELHLIDYKTTGRPPAALDEESALQLRSYGLLALESHGAPRARLTYQFLKNQQELSETFHASETAGVVRDLVDRISLTRSATDFPPAPSALCSWCGYREICDASGFFEGCVAEGRRAGADRCPSCEGRLRQRQGRYGAFLGCENFPRCRYTRDA